VTGWPPSIPGTSMRLMARSSGNRAFRGLALVFVLSFVNLIGVVVTATALGGVAPWTRWQFIGLFGVLELASGLANVISPNLWRLPVAELHLSGRGKVRLAASTILVPHWGGLARSAAGLVLVVGAATQEGVAPASLALVPVIAALALSILAASAILARAGVARPDLDVLQFTVRWGQRERALAPISIGASALQFVLTIATIPIAKLLSPSILYQPELAPSLPGTLALIGASVVLAGIGYAVWAGRLALQAPAEQQREAEKYA
jgi:hypothetical protein